MKRITPLLLSLVTCLFISGCATVSPEQLQAEIARVGYGEPLPSDWQATIKSFMEIRLKDSASAIYKFEEPKQGYLENPPISGGGLKAAGYLVQVLINAKNSYGGYTGFQAYQFLLRDGKVIAYAERTGDFWMWY